MRREEHEVESIRRRLSQAFVFIFSMAFMVLELV